MRSPHAPARPGLSWIGLAALVTLAACGRTVPTTEGATALWLNLHRAGEVDLFVDEGALDAGERTAARWSATSPLRVRCAPLTNGFAGSGARVVAGTPASSELTALLGHVGVSFENGRLVRAPHSFSLAGLTLRATFEDPDRPGLPLTLLVADDVASLGRALGELSLDPHPVLSIERRGVPAFQAQLSVSGRAHTDRQRDLGAERAGARSSFVPFGERVAGFTIRIERGVARRSAQDYAEHLALVHERLARWAPVSSLRGLRLLFRIHGCDRLARERGGELVVWLGEGLPRRADGGTVLATSLLLDALGSPAHEWVADAAAIDAAGEWWGVQLERWCARVASLEGAPDLAGIVEGAEGASPHLLRPLRGLLFRFLVESGADPLQLWDGQTLEAALAEHGGAFSGKLAELVRAHAEEGEARRAAAGAIPRARMPLRGAALDGPPGAAVGSGFGTSSCATSLDDLVARGANVVAIHSYLFLDEAGTPRTLAGDTRLASGLGQVRALRASTILVPHFLASPTGIAWGERKMTTRAEWAEFFDAYELALTHSALIAQAVRADVLCVGFGMPEAGRTVWTLKVPESANQAMLRAFKRERWLGVIRRVRSVYDGALTYSAGGPDKLAWCDFWDELDFIGFTFYPSLATKERPWRPSDRELVRRVSRGLTRAIEFAAERDQEPILLETAFRSTTRAWRGDERRRNGGAFDGELQARLVRVFAEALRTVDQDQPAASFAGWILWGWSCNPDASGFGRGYGLRGKPVEDVLASVFRR